MVLPSSSLHPMGETGIEGAINVIQEGIPSDHAVKVLLLKEGQGKTRGQVLKVES